MQTSPRNAAQGGHGGFRGAGWATRDPPPRRERTTGLVRAAVREAEGGAAWA